MCGLSASYVREEYQDMYIKNAKNVTWLLMSRAKKNQFFSIMLALYSTRTVVTETRVMAVVLLF